MENLWLMSIELSLGLIKTSQRLASMMLLQNDNPLSEKYQESIEIKESLFVFILFLNYKKIEELYSNSKSFFTFKSFFLNTLENTVSITTRESLENYLKEFEEKSDFISLVDISSIKYFISRFDKESAWNLMVIVLCLNFLKPVISTINEIDKDFLSQNYNFSI